MVLGAVAVVMVVVVLVVLVVVADEFRLVDSAVSFMLLLILL